VTTGPSPFLIEVVKGDPSDEELAAVVAVLLAVAEAADPVAVDPTCCPRAEWRPNVSGVRPWTLGSPWATSLRGT